MALVNIEWFNKNEQRNYPLELNAGRVGVDGNRLPNNILVDAHIWFPGESSDRLFVSSCVITANLLTLTFAIDNAEQTPVAAINISKDTVLYRNIRVKEFLSGTTGWIAVGVGLTSAAKGSWRFTSPSETLLMKRCATGVDADNYVSDIRRAGRSMGLRDLVKISSGTSDLLKIFPAKRTIGGIERNCLVFALNLDESGDGLLADYIGPCDKRPDSNNCLRPIVRYLNTIEPDCAGTAYLDFSEIGSVYPGPLMSFRQGDISTLFIDYLKGVAEICADAKSVVPTQLDQCDTNDFQDPGPWPIP